MERRTFKASFLGLALLACPGLVLSMGLPLPSLPLVIEAKGMGNAVVADGTLFNASAYNPALLANHPDTVQFHLSLNAGNDAIGMVDYLTNSSNIDDLQNSMKNVSPSFSNIQNGLDISQHSNTVDVNQYNQGVVGLQDAISNIQKALNTFTGKSVQVGAGLDVAVKIDDHLGFQVYNSTQAAVQVGHGGLVSALLALKNLPLLQGGSGPQVQAEAVSFYSSSSSILNAFLDSTQQQKLNSAVTTFAGSSGSLSDIQTFANDVNSVLSSVTQQSSQQTLFNDIVPIEILTFSDTVLMGTYCFRPMPEDAALSVGVNLKAVNRRIASINSLFLAKQNTTDFSDVGNDRKDDIQKTTWRWGADLGVLYEFSDPRVAVGVSATDLIHSTATLDTASTDPLYGVVTDSAPTVLRAGASFRPLRELTVNCDVDDILGNTSYFKSLDLFSHVDFGFNYDLWKILQLRGGLTNGNLSGGLGLPLGIQYAFSVDNLTQSYNHYLQFDVAF